MKALVSILLLLSACQSRTRKPQSSDNLEEPLFVSRPVTERNVFSHEIDGPAVDREGHLYVANIGHKGTIAKQRPGEAPELWWTLPDNGVSAAIRFTPEGDILIADYRNHRIYTGDRMTHTLHVYAENAQMNQPNDMTVAQNGVIFLSDPSWSSKKQGSIWRITRTGQMEKMATDLKAVNGIDLSPDETKLYYTESIQGRLYSYDLHDGQLSHRQLLAEMAPDTVDGIRTDMAGRIYVVRILKGTVDRFAPDGKFLDRIPLLGKEPTNLAFGGHDGRTVYVTMRDGGCVEAFRVDSPGRDWFLGHR